MRRESSLKISAYNQQVHLAGQWKTTWCWDSYRVRSEVRTLETDSTCLIARTCAVYNESATRKEYGNNAPRARVAKPKL